MPIFDNPTYAIRDEDQLTALYGPPRSIRKTVSRLDEYCRAFIAASPMVIVGTNSGDAADNSPRGDAPGFVKVVDDDTLLIPDRKGNNRLDTLRNIVRNPSVALLFLIPGVTKTVRVCGDATVSCDPALTAQFSGSGKEPKTVLVVRVKEAFLHCSRALESADLWNPAKAVRDVHTCEVR